MARIAVGGFGHETNSFVAHRADFAYFVDHRDRPPLVLGQDVIDRLHGTSFPIAGFIDAVAGRHSLAPLVWAHGGAGGPVTADAFDRITGELVERLAGAMPVDAVYLELHGAMVAENFEDGDAELLRRVRAVAGNIPIVASLDYHANVTPEMVALADGLAIYRTYPHVDRPETGARAAAIIDRLLATGRPAGRALRKLPFLIPATAQCTLVEPSRSIVARSSDPPANISSIGYAAGFPASDVFWCGPAAFAYADTAHAAHAAAAALGDFIEANEAEFAAELLPPDRAVAHGIAIAARTGRPVIIADVQDNPGGGGSGDTTGLLTALVDAGADRAVLGIFTDAEAARAAHAAGEGAELRLSLGGRSGPEGVIPLDTVLRVKRIGSGRFRTTGSMTGGADVDLGPMALLSIGGVDVVVASKRMQAFDRAPFEHLGVDLSACAIIAVKSTVHFRAEFEPLAAAVILAAAPGAFLDDPRRFPFQRLRTDVRRSPRAKSIDGV